MRAAVKDEEWQALAHEAAWAGYMNAVIAEHPGRLRQKDIEVQRQAEMDMEDREDQLAEWWVQAGSSPEHFEKLKQYLNLQAAAEAEPGDALLIQQLQAARIEYEASRYADEN